MKRKKREKKMKKEGVEIIQYLIKTILLIILKANGRDEVQGGVVDEVQGVLGVVEHHKVETQPNHTAN